MRPDETEYQPWAKGYVDCVEGSDVVEALTANTKDYRALVSRLDGLYRYAPGKWTVNEIVGHVTDAERIFAYRLLCIARGDQTPFPAFEQDDYLAVSGFNDRTLADLLAEFEAVRQASILLMRGLPAEAWSRRGTVGGYRVTPRGIAFQLAGHERHHCGIFRAKYLQV
jgi:DinB superfamily